MNKSVTSESIPNNIDFNYNKIDTCENNDIKKEENNDTKKEENFESLELNKYYSSKDMFVQVFDNVIDKEVCKDIIDVFEKNKEKQYNGVTAGGYTPQTKITKEINFSYGSCLFKFDDIVHDGLKRSYLNYIKNVNSFYDNVYDFSKDLGDTGYQLQRYNKNEGRYKWHVDTSDELDYVTNHGVRKYAFLLYLNDVDEGGETGFLIKDLNNTKPQAGRFLIFPTTDQYVHCGFMPKSNDKYIVTGWLHTKNKNNL